MRPAPERIGGLRVRLSTVLDGRHEPTGACRHIVAGGTLGPADALAICENEDGAFFLFYCDADWGVVADTWHETIEGAKNQASFEYFGVASTWVAAT